MAVYEGTSTQMKVIETDLYGSTRLGLTGTQTVVTAEQTLSGFGTVRTFTFTRGEKSYELTNHLGNVLSTISDRRQQIPVNSTVSYYTAEVISATDYYPFGMQMPNRTLSSSSYRYGFNGKENDNDVKGNGNQLNFGARIYDSRIGKFLSLDPMARSYVGESNYSFAGNSPIQSVDFDGYFKISSFFVQKYPTLTRIIQDYLPLLKQNPQAKEGWITTIGFTNHAEGEKAFDDMVSYGQGPWITPTRPSSDQKDGYRQDLNGFFEPTGSAGEFQGIAGYPDNATINYTYLDKLEAAVKKGDANDIGQQMFVISVLIMHESAHWGKWKYNCCEVSDDRFEAGAKFEYNTFGTRFSYQNPDKRYFDVDDAKSYYNKQKGSYGTPSFGFSINQSTSYWDRMKRFPVGSGQKGDPSLKENHDVEPEPKVYTSKSTYYTPGTSNNGGSYE